MSPESKRIINQVEPWLGDEEKTAILEYLDSGGWLTEFRKTKEFEKAIANYTGSKYAVAVNNGTISLIIALMALGIGSGDEVIVPDYTMIASANAVVFTGARPVLIDIDAENNCLDLKKAEKAITKRTRAVMYVNLNGRCHDMNVVVAFAKAHNLYLIEDAAQALGSVYNKKHLGTFGDIGSFSFSTAKIITTGQGGALVTDSDEYYELIWRIKDFGRSKSGVDYHVIMGFNAKFTDLQAVIGIEQMKKLAERVRKKKELFRLYRQFLEDIDEIELISTNLEDCAPWFIDILVESRGLREELSKHLKEKGIGTRPFYPAIHTQPPYADVRGDFKNSEVISETGLWLPSSSFLQDEDIQYVCNEIRSFYHGID